MAFIKATKKQCKLRAGLMGVAGSGKTYSALRLATGLGGKIALIDTERKSAGIVRCPRLITTVWGYCLTLFI